MSGKPIMKRSIDPDEVDALLAAELNEMSFHEREKMYEQIHGVERQEEETSEQVTTSLREMEVALTRLPNREIYLKAARINPKYVEDKSFRLMFLRSEYFNVEKAAQRLTRFLEGKVRLFGESTLARPICLKDFNEDDLAFLESGIIQQIPSRDRSGRAILVDFNMDPSVDQPKNIDSFLRTVAYVALSAAEDIETQKRGCVGIFYFTSVLETQMRVFERGEVLFDWLPIKIVGGHFCYNDQRLRLVQALSLLVIGRQPRLRVRIHEGSHTECQYKLMTFGVPVKDFPVTYDGDLKISNHLKWLERRKIKEEILESVGNFEGIDLPGSKDVLLGRGKSFQNHSGNVLLRNVIKAFVPEYRRTAKMEKGTVVWKVVALSKAMGVRFLKRDTNGWWQEVPDEVARGKVSMAFRTSTCSEIANTPLSIRR